MGTNFVQIGEEVVVDLTNDSVTPETLAEGATAHDKSGNLITGLATQITITQEAGNSESLVMSQKAVTELVAEALAEPQYETVSSIEEMTDMSKSYILNSTGTIWVYGYMGLKPTFTNLAKKLTTGRLNSSGNVDATATDATTCEDYIGVLERGDVIRVKGFGALTEYNTAWYSAIGSVYATNKVGNPSSDHHTSWSYTYDSATDTVSLTKPDDSSSRKYIRFSGVLTGTTDDVIITLNEEIAYTDSYGWYDTGMTSSTGGASSYVTVDSVEEMTDTSKSYVLHSTGTLWAYGEVTVDVEPPNKFVPSTATLNQRLYGSSGSVSANDVAKGSFVSDFISVSNLGSISPYLMRLNWELDFTSNGEDKIVYYNSSKTRVGNTVFTSNGNNVLSVSNGETVLDISTAYDGELSFNLTDVAYIRVQLYVTTAGTSIASNDITNLTITFDADGGTKTENAWYDTGLKPSAGGGGGSGNYVNLLVKINENKTDIAELNNRVTAIETGSETLTVPAFWQSAVDVCISKIKALQVGRNCITFPFFSDNHQNVNHGSVGVMIAHIMKECNIPYCFYGGDSITSGRAEQFDTEAELIAQDKRFDTMMSYVPNGRFCRAVGNHDGYLLPMESGGDGITVRYSRDQIYDLFLREESISQNKHFGGDGTYYYIDDISSKVRWVVLNTNGVDSTQLSWLQNTALSFNESDWAVVFISHQPISNHYHAGIVNAAEVRTVIKNYINGSATNKAAIVGWYSGHIHKDRIYTGVAVNTEDDAEGEAIGFKQVTITSDNTGIAYDSATQHPVANDNKSHAIDFVTINKSTRTVNITRLGIGNDRSYTY